MKRAVAIVYYMPCLTIGCKLAFLLLNRYLNFCMPRGETVRAYMISWLVRVLGSLFQIWQQVPPQTKQAISDELWRVVEPLFAKIFDMLKKSRSKA